MEMEREVAGCGERGHEFGLFLGSVTDAVVDVYYGKYDA
jgi:hypothetical protein